MKFPGSMFEVQVRPYNDNRVAGGCQQAFGIYIKTLAKWNGSGKM